MKTKLLFLLFILLCALHTHRAQAQTEPDSLVYRVETRDGNGLEFGVGPNVSVAGAGLVFAAGANFQSQGVNFPVNLAVTPSAHGGRVSLLFGFNSRRY